MLFFADRIMAADSAPGTCVLQIDTVLVLERGLLWEGGRVPEAYSHLMDEETESLWIRHFKRGLGPEADHPGRITFEARMWSLESSGPYSFLPISREQRPIISNRELAELSPELPPLLRNAARGRMSQPQGTLIGNSFPAKLDLQLRTPCTHSCPTGRTLK
jgi:hypothetical protein